MQERLIETQLQRSALHQRIAYATVTESHGELFVKRHPIRGTFSKRFTRLYPFWKTGDFESSTCHIRWQTGTSHHTRLRSGCRFFSSTPERTPDRTGRRENALCRAGAIYGSPRCQKDRVMLSTAHSRRLGLPSQHKPRAPVLRFRARIHTSRVSDPRGGGIARACPVLSPSGAGKKPSAVAPPKRVSPSQIVI